MTLTDLLNFDFNRALLIYSRPEVLLIAVDHRQTHVGAQCPTRVVTCVARGSPHRPAKL
jgi:hypothetical protein